MELITKYGALAAMSLIVAWYAGWFLASKDEKRMEFGVLLIVLWVVLLIIRWWLLDSEVSWTLSRPRPNEYPPGYQEPPSDTNWDAVFLAGTSEFLTVAISAILAAGGLSFGPQKTKRKAG